LSSSSNARASSASADSPSRSGDVGDSVSSPFARFDLEDAFAALAELTLFFSASDAVATSVGSSVCSRAATRGVPVVFTSSAFAPSTALRRRSRASARARVPCCVDIRVLCAVTCDLARTRRLGARTARTNVTARTNDARSRARARVGPPLAARGHAAALERARASSARAPRATRRTRSAARRAARRRRVARARRARSIVAGVCDAVFSRALREESRRLDRDAYAVGRNLRRSERHSNTKSCARSRENKHTRAKP